MFLGDIDSQYEQYLVGQAIQQCQDGSDLDGRAAGYLVQCGICPLCYKETDGEMYPTCDICDCSDP